MQNDNYNRIIGRLRFNKPAPESAASLTDNIMESLSHGSRTQHRYILLKANQKEWTLFTGIRKFMTAAAILLVGFFIYQQWHINDKLNKLQDQVVMAQKNPVYGPKINADFQHVNYLLQSEALTSILDSHQEDELMINRRSLNYLIKRIRQLENENLSYRDKLQQYYIDSSNINP